MDILLKKIIIIVYQMNWNINNIFLVYFGKIIENYIQISRKNLTIRKLWATRRICKIEFCFQTLHPLSFYPNDYSSVSGTK